MALKISDVTPTSEAASDSALPPPNAANAATISAAEPPHSRCAVRPKHGLRRRRSIG